MFFKIKAIVMSCILVMYLNLIATHNTGFRINHINPSSIGCKILTTGGITDNISSILVEMINPKRITIDLYIYRIKDS